MVSLDQFLKSLKEKYENKSIDELIQEISNKANIDMNIIDTKTKVKFTRYVTYFKQVFIM
jgi:hypothetical protein